MTENLEIRILNLKKAMNNNKAKSIIRYKFKKYYQAYDNKDKDVKDKQEYRDLSLEFYRYMNRSEDGKY